MERPHAPKWHRALEGLSQEETESIHQRMRTQRFAPRASLFQQGAPSDSLMVVRHGRVRLFITSPEGEEFTLSMLTDGSILGLAAVVLRQPRILSVEAMGAADVSILPAAQFEACMRSIPQLTHNVMRLLAILAVENIERSAPLVLDSAPQRLGRILLALAVRAADGRQQVQQVTHDELGKMIGASRPWVSLTLAGFERRGLLTRQPGRIVIHDAQGLLGQPPTAIPQRHHPRA